MIRNYLAAALHNLARSPLYAAINVIGLAVGFAAALLIGLYVRQELSYDRWLPHYDQVVRISSIATFTAQSHDDLDAAPFVVAPLLKQEFPGVRAVVRLTGGHAVLKHGEVEAEENFVWTDPSLFDVLAFPLVAGDPATALQAPNSVVLTQRMARKYFGRENVIGEIIEFGQGRSMRIAGVLRDLPPDTHLNIDIVASGRSEFSPLARLDAGPPPGTENEPVLTYVRLSSASMIDGLRHFLPGFVERHGQFAFGNTRWTLMATPLSELHLTPPTSNRLGGSAVKPLGNPTALRQLGVIGILTLVVAGINFVTLSTARAGRRAVEIGVRKALGARRRHIFVQFICEAIIVVGLALVLAMTLVEIVLPALAAFLATAMRFDYWADPALLASILAMGVLVAIIAGFYPALVLSSFRPVNALRGAAVGQPASIAPRQILVAIQFAIAVALVLATVTIYRQVHFALTEGLRLDTDQVLLVATGTGACDGPVRNEIAAVPGVQAVACSASMLTPGVAVTARSSGGNERKAIPARVGIGYFELYGLHPLAGRFFTDQDADRAGNAATNPPVVINETALRDFGFASAAAAIGRTVSWRRPLTFSYNHLSDFLPSEIIGVVPDFPIGTIASPVGPTFFWIDPQWFSTLNVKLSGRQIPGTLAAIDSVLKRVSGGPPHHVFFNQAMQDLYADVVRQGYLFAVFAAVAIVVAALGLFGLSAFMAERRTKEIGIRKVMGASTSDILRLLIWEFARPVLWANIIAWPIAYVIMSNWLHGFAYHIDLSLWMFAVAGGLALVIAAATVTVQSLLAARANPVTALRYE